MDPLTLTLIEAAAAIGSAFIGIAPDIIAQRKRHAPTQSNTEFNAVLTQQSNIQKDLERIKQDLARQELQNQTQYQAKTLSDDQLRFYAEQLRQQKELEKQLAIYNFKAQIEVANHQRETALKLPEVNKLFDNWPLTLVPSQILNSSRKESRIPLKVFIAPPKINFSSFASFSNDNSIDKIDLRSILAQGLGEFLDKHYPIQNPQRPSEFLGGAWNNQNFRRESSVRALFSMLKSEPTLILESEIIDHGYLSIRVGYWGIGQESYCYQYIAKIPYREIIRESIKNRARQWRKDKQRLISLGKTEEEIQSIEEDCEFNLRILEQEEDLKSNGIDIKRFSLKDRYRISPQDIEYFSDILKIAYCMISAWIIDAHFFIHYDVAPALPQIMPEIITLRGAEIHPSLDNLFRGIVTGYRMLYAEQLNERPSWVPELTLQLALSLAKLPDKSWAMEQVRHSIDSWLRQRQRQSSVGQTETLEVLLDNMKPFARLDDTSYIQDLKLCFSLIGNSGVKSRLLDLDWQLKQDAKRLDFLYTESRAYGKSGHYQKAIENLNDVIQINPNFTEAYFSRGFIFSKCNQLDRAILDYTSVIRLKPDYYQAYVNRGNIYYKNLQYSIALEDYEQALKLNSDLPEIHDHLSDIRKKLNI